MAASRAAWTAPMGCALALRWPRGCAAAQLAAKSLSNEAIAAGLTGFVR
jgi:hypothetical protein